ncbi:N-glycosylase/DNA lyase isoform X3 [Carcharodon carcharias]|uniref:N-glycosylase/DNA lyase isoform X3 n=1 Tax=Carcharodon carcharias TaxID=13397 RepID=UPI001B7F0C1E|nr:N-glycosylase/DNA lyase isoform X3 [Carcharodon carcharias]
MRLGAEVQILEQRIVINRGRGDSEGIQVTGYQQRVKLTKLRVIGIISGQLTDKAMQRHTTLTSCSALWHSLPCARSELRLDIVLSCGQSFRWQETSPGHWTGVLANRVWTLKQTEDKIWYRTYSKEAENATQLSTGHKKRKGPSTNTIGVKVKKENRIKMEFKSEDGDFAKREMTFPEVKMEPVEHMQQMNMSTPGLLKSESSAVDEGECRILTDYFQLHVRLSELYSRWSQADKHFERVAQDFPGDDVEKQLRVLGFGYRAKFVNQSAKMILDKHGSDWLNSLREAPYEEAKRALCTLPGVGTKVADCVCLMSLDKAEVIPVDTHVWQIMKRDYQSHLGSGQRTLTDKVYREIGDYFRNLWGPFAGWAHSVLFSADLKRFQEYKSKQELQQNRDTRS